MLHVNIDLQPHNQFNNINTNDTEQSGLPGGRKFNLAWDRPNNILSMNAAWLRNIHVLSNILSIWRQVCQSHAFSPPFWYTSSSWPPNRPKWNFITLYRWKLLHQWTATHHIAAWQLSMTRASRRTCHKSPLLVMCEAWQRNNNCVIALHITCTCCELRIHHTLKQSTGDCTPPFARRYLSGYRNGSSDWGQRSRSGRVQCLRHRFSLRSLPAVDKQWANRRPDSYSCRMFEVIRHWWDEQCHSAVMELCVSVFDRIPYVRDAQFRI